MKTYSTKANARRAARNAGFPDAEIQFNEPGWIFLVSEPQLALTDLVGLPSVESLCGYNPQALLGYKPAKAAKAIKSSAKSPVKMVWEIADRMWGERRSVIIQACVEAGIAYNTARTQYQAFYQIKSMERK